MRDDNERPKAARYRNRHALMAQIRTSALSSNASRATPPSLTVPANSWAFEQWETYITTLVADADQQAEFLANTWPEVTFPRYAAQALIPQLNAMGAQGWEPVSIQPVNFGVNGDIVMPDYKMGYSHQYFCVFKRRKA